MIAVNGLKKEDILILEVATECIVERLDMHISLKREQGYKNEDISFRAEGLKTGRDFHLIIFGSSEYGESEVLRVYLPNPRYDLSKLVNIARAQALKIAERLIVPTSQEEGDEE